MGCFGCFHSRRQDKKPLNLQNEGLYMQPTSSAPLQIPPSEEKSKGNETIDLSVEGSQHIAAQTFTFRELAAATKNFRSDCLIGEGGFGCVYKGRLESTGQIVAVKQL
eukprot:c30072_g1_i1 orf=1-321(-)